MTYDNTIILIDTDNYYPFGILRTDGDEDEVKELIENACDNWRANDFDMDIDTYFLKCLDNHGYKYEYEDLYKCAGIVLI